MSPLFLFLRRTKEKPPVESDSDEEQIPEVEVPEEPPRVEENDIEILLTRARFPLNTRSELLKVLGDNKAEISVGSKVYLACEIADRCFSGKTTLNSAHEVIEAINETSWIKVVMGKLHMLPFPVDSKEQLGGRLRETYVDGVPVLDLIEDLEFPVNSPSDLLVQLAKPRSSPVVPDQPSASEDAPGEEGVQDMEVPSEAEEPPVESPVQLAEETPV